MHNWVEVNMDETIHQGPLDARLKNVLKSKGRRGLVHWLRDSIYEVKAEIVSDVWKGMLDAWILSTWICVWLLDGWVFMGEHGNRHRSSNDTCDCIMGGFQVIWKVVRWIDWLMGGIRISPLKIDWCDTEKSRCKVELKVDGFLRHTSRVFFIYKISSVMGFSKYCDDEKKAKTLSSKTTRTGVFFLMIFKKIF